MARGYRDVNKTDKINDCGVWMNTNMRYPFVHCESSYPRFHPFPLFPLSRPSIAPTTVHGILGRASVALFEFDRVRVASVGREDGFERGDNVFSRMYVENGCEMMDFWNWDGWLMYFVECFL